MRAREFIMKDAYSFHLDQASLEATYDMHADAYARIFTRLGLSSGRCDADGGEIGGSRSQEFHVLADSGEDRIACATATLRRQRRVGAALRRPATAAARAASR